MLYIPLTVICILGGFVLYFFGFIMPFELGFVKLITEWLSLFILVIPSFIWVYVIGKNRLLWNVETLPPDKFLIWFIRRDGSIVPVLGTRAYPGESFIEVPKLGLIHDLGKGSVCRIGKNNVRFALENVNHTPNPSFVNFTSWLYDCGFNDLSEVRNTLEGVEGFEDKRVVAFEAIEASKEGSVGVLKRELVEDSRDVVFKPVRSHKEVSRLVDVLVPKVLKDGKRSE